MRTLPLLALALALASAGCIQNMDDLRNRVAGADGEPVQPAAVAPTPSDSAVVANATPPKPPVARASVFAPNGALLFKSTFAAEDPAEVVVVEAKSKLTLNAGDSEALERGATLTGFAWTLDGKPLEGGRAASVEVGEAGLYVLVLTVTDTSGSKDTQTVKLGVAPEPFEVVTELTSGPVVGAEGQGQAATLTFDLAPAGDAPANVVSVTFTAAPGAACDLVLEVLDANGESLGTKDDGSVGEEETVTAGALPYGAYSIVLSPFACVAPDGVPVVITAVYLPTVEGLGGDGHGPHAH